MSRYMILRLLQAAPTFAFVVVLTFAIVHLAPGDPAWALAGENASPEYVESIRVRYGLDQPLGTQFATYVGRLLQGDLGFSWTYRQPVGDLLRARIPSTLLLVLVGQILGVVGGTFLGAYSARRFPSWFDSVVNALTLGLYSLPMFWLGLVMLLAFTVWGHFGLPSGGMYTIPRLPGLLGTLDVIKHMLLPTATLTLYTLPTYYRLTRDSVLSVMLEDYVVTARAIGYSESRVFMRHCLRNALLPSITMAGMMFGSVFAGALLTETIFAWPGIGRLMYEAVFQRDYPLAMGVFMLSSVCVIVLQLITDLVYAAVDPRIRYD